MLGSSERVINGMLGGPREVPGGAIEEYLLQKDRGTKARSAHRRRDLGYKMVRKMLSEKYLMRLWYCLDCYLGQSLIEFDIRVQWLGTGRY